MAAITAADERELRRKRLFLFDMDGTIYLGDVLFAGMTELLEQIRDIGGRAVFVTNNSSKSVTDYVAKLRHMGIEVGPDDFMTSTQALGLHLAATHRGGAIYVLGTRALLTTLRDDYALPVTDRLQPGITTLVLGFDTELTFGKLQDACQLLADPGLTYLATNPDLVCPVEYGYVPDCGSIAQILRNATGRMPDVIGKPEPAMIELAMKWTGHTPPETVVVGDRLYTDVASGVNAGVCSVLVLSGESTLQTIAESRVKPDIVLRDISQLNEILRGSK